jgi:L-iditol 2-dehydrogenase
MGHEFCGQVEEVNGTQTDLLKGRRVISHALIHCGECRICLRGDTNLCVHRQVFGMHRPGAFAEYVAVPERVLIPWPDGLPAASAVFTEPLANGINAMRQGANARRSRVVVIGAGPIGLMCIFAAKRLYQSSVVISDRLPERLDAALVLGADHTVNALHQNLATETRKHWGGERAEFVVDAVGSAETKLLSLDLVEPGGMVVWVGLHDDLIQLNSYALTLGQKCVAGSYSGSVDDLRQAAQLLAAGNFETSWATRYPLDEGEAGFRDMLLRKGNKIKAILEFQEGV